MKTQRVSVMARSSRSAPGSAAAAASIERALDMFTAAGVGFEVVARCPTVCRFCDGAAAAA